MIRYEKKMSEIYGLGRPCSWLKSESESSTLLLFLSYSGNDFCGIELPKSLGGALSNHLDERTLFNYANSFEKSCTFLHYLTIDECRNIIKESPRWKLAIDAGLSVLFTKPYPEIVERRGIDTPPTLIIATPIPDWKTLNDNMRKLIEVERTIEDWRMKGENLRRSFRHERLTSIRDA